jgi:proline racemase
VFDSHTGGTATRLLMNGLPLVPGKDMIQRKAYFQKNYDYIRTTLMQEPRGNSGIAAILVPPSNPIADYGVLFCDYRGYVDMCIHGTIGVVTTLIEQSLIEKKIAESGKIVFDTPAGLVYSKAKLHSRNAQRVESVTVSNVPSFFLRDATIEISGAGRINASVAFGGNIYAYVKSNDLKLKLASTNLKEILSVGRNLLKELKQLEVSHPEIESIKGVMGVSIYEDISPKNSRNIMIAENDLFDRSPCGTGTCGRMAVLSTNGELSRGEEFLNQGIIGTKFTGIIKEETRVGQHAAILPEINGSAYMTGISDLVISDGDKLGTGFNV